MQCGASRKIINPELGHKLAGYGSDYPCEGIHDDLSLSCLYLNDGEEESIFIVYDLVGMKKNYVDTIREAISETTLIPISHILLHCTHVHSGPMILKDNLDPNIPEDKQQQDYKDKVIKFSAEAAAEAKSNQEECELLYNYAQVSENMNRRFFLPNREHFFIPLAKQLVGQSTEFVDEELGIIAFRKKGTPNKYKAIISNYTAHPLCVGNTSNLATADYQGQIRKTVEGTFDGVICLSTTGAAGDHHPRKPESGFDEAERMGKTIGTVLIERLYDATKCPDTKLRMAYNDITLKGLNQDDVSTCYGLLGIGPIMLCGLPGELAAILGAQIKYSSPFLKSFSLHLSTDIISYLSARNQFYWGGYEPNSSSVEPGQAEVLVNDILKAAEVLVSESPLNLPEIKPWDGKH
ncbi:MAG: hypothetical protein COA79_09220 [Planctomycetota bacterium]|nr:MAG: hypothetical protein COA79_09220 [Planctomycetota bacterium]